MNYTLSLYKTFCEKLLKEKKINPHQVPKIKKISISICEGKDANDKNTMIEIQRQLSIITGQKSIHTYAKSSQAAFKIREGMILGAKVTLRRKKMYDFLDRFIYIALPRMKDFKGFSTDSVSDLNFTNVCFGVSDLHVFPEINYAFPNLRSGANVSFSFDGCQKEEIVNMLKSINIPFNK